MRHGSAFSSLRSRRDFKIGLTSFPRQPRLRRILVESARRKKRLKHGGEFERVELDTVEVPLPMPADELLALDEALDRLVKLEPRAAEVVKLCFFVGLTQEQAAKELGISISTVERLWGFARAWLFQEMKGTRGEKI